MGHRRIRGGKGALDSSLSKAHNHAIQDVWGSATFQGLSSVLRSAYWYCDVCKGSGRRGVFGTIADMDPSGECMRTYPGWATQEQWNAMGFCPGEPVPVCGQALKDAHYP